MCFAQGQNAVKLMRLEPAILQSLVKHSTTIQFVKKAIVFQIMGIKKLFNY